MRDGDPTVHQLPNRKSISVIFITARSYPFSPLFQQETNGHAEILAAVIISSRIRRLTSKRNSGVTVTYPKSKRL